MKFVRLTLVLLLGCPVYDDDSAVPVDDDSAATGDDDSVADDDDTTPPDDDDDDVSDDDDDDTAAPDYDLATIPDYADCAGNSFKVMLGDATTIGPFDGEFGVPGSFSNTNAQWQIRIGPGTSMLTQLQGNRTGYVVNTDITMAIPTSVAGNVAANVAVDAAQIGASPAVLAGGYGYPQAGADPRVGGTVHFTALPDPGANAVGTFSAILQNPQQIPLGNVLLIGVRGCFNLPLQATDAGG